MKIWKVYADANGESHFQQIDIGWESGQWRGGQSSKRMPVAGMIFREASGKSELDWHPAPRRQIVIGLDSGWEVTTSDGESRIIPRGEPLLLEDTHGKGHMTRNLNEEGTRRGLMIPLDKE